MVMGNARLAIFIFKHFQAYSSLIIETVLIKTSNKLWLKQFDVHWRQVLDKRFKLLSLLLEIRSKLSLHYKRPIYSTIPKSTIEVIGFDQAFYYPF